MKKRLICLLLLFCLVCTALAPCALAADRQYGATPIYLGYADVDYMAEEILKEIPTAGKSSTEQIRAVYDWIIQNCSRYEWDGQFHFNEAVVAEQARGDFYEHCISKVDAGEIVLRNEYVSAPNNPQTNAIYLDYDSSAYIASFAYEMMLKRTGNCAHYAALLAVLLGHLGFDCRLIDGDFINQSGSSVEHKWNCVLVDGAYYWLDVRMDHSMYASTGKIGYYYFLEPSTAVWSEQHSWNHDYSDWLFAHAAEVAEQYVIDITIARGEPWSRCSSWAQNYVTRGAESGLVPDSLRGTDLTKQITRAEFAAMAVATYESLSGKTVSDYSGENPFSDTADPAVLRAYGLGIVTGVDDNHFSPDRFLTREQAVTILGRVYELTETGQIGTGSDLSYSIIEPFADASSISEYAEHYVLFFVDRGILQGVGDHQFAPKSAMTREQAIKTAVESVDRL